MSKVSTSLADVIATTVRPGSTVYVGNFGAQLFCVGTELIRSGFRDLHVISGGLLLDQLIGAGTVRAVTFAHCWNPIGPQPAWNLRRAAEAGADVDVQTNRVEIRELSLGMLGAAFQAAAWDLPFMPIVVSSEVGYVSDGWSGDLIGTVDGTFGKSYVVSALRPDVAFLHADVVDQSGNAFVRQPYGEHIVAAQAARCTVVVAEEVLPPGARLPETANLAGVHVDAVVAVPGAVAPDGTPGRYPRDVEAYADYGRDSASPELFQQWLRRTQRAAPR